MTQLHCPDDERLERLRSAPVPEVNAIDHIVVLPSRVALAVHCFAPVDGTAVQHVQLSGGVRERPEIDDVLPASAPAAEAFLGDAADWAAVPTDPAARERVLLVRTSSAGDFSRYFLCIDRPGADPPWDPVLSKAGFSFKVDCPSDFDCAGGEPCPPVARPSPRIDYLAKDYASFRRLMLDRLAETAPGWRERNPVDLGMALVEVIAYAADQLSYHQDAAATEAYLGTARSRISVRRHARLVDYHVGEGQAARTWLAFAGENGLVVPKGTRVHSGRVPLAPLEDWADDRPLDEAVRAGAVVFETLHPVETRRARDRIVVHNWGDDRCCLPRGATSATLRGRPATLGLTAGDVLILELVRDDGRPLSNDARRHAVRLTSVGSELHDRVANARVFDIAWHDEDALPFALDVGLRNDRRLVALGNVALAEHGLTVAEKGRFPAGLHERPQLERRGISHALPYDHDDARRAPARAVLAARPQDAAPVAEVLSGGDVWRPERDLLRTGPYGQRFVVEVHTDGRAQLRFGDDANGRRPPAGSPFEVVYRVGNGPAGNVGADSLDRLHPGFGAGAPLPAGLEVRNPVPATGGTAPETLSEARLAAPVAFRRQERAVTPADYAEAAMRLPEVQKATASRRWTGSWYTYFVTVDRRGGRAVDAEFEAVLRARFDAVRLAGYDVEIDAPAPAAIDLALEICVAPGLRRERVRAAVRAELSARVLADGRRGFFHPDEFTFGQSVYLSRIVARAMAVAGVQSVRPTVFQRWREPAGGELQDGELRVGRLEIARLDDDPNRPENGRLTLTMRGGQ